MTDGTPTSMSKFFNSPHTAFAVKDFSRYTAGHLVHASTMHKQYLCPAADVRSIGPTTSIVIRLKAVSSLGIGVIGTLSITKLLVFNWHFPQDTGLAKCIYLSSHLWRLIFSYGPLHHLFSIFFRFFKQTCNWQFFDSHVFITVFGF